MSPVLLSNSATYSGKTFATLGVTPGTYEWTWGNGANQNFTVHIPPITTSGTWTPTGSLNTARADFTATLLPNGKVLVAGGLISPSLHRERGIVRSGERDLDRYGQPRYRTV